MKLIRMLIGSLLGQVEPSFFEENRTELRNTNYKLLKKACLFSTGMCAFLFVLTLNNALISELRVFYLVFTGLFFLMTGFVVTWVNQNRFATPVVFGIFAIAVFVLVINVGTCLTPQLPAVTFHVFLLVVPILFVTRPIYTVGISLAATVAFCMVTAAVKGADSFLGQTDILNAICCCIVGIGFDVTIMNLQLDNIRGKTHFRRQSATDELTGLPNRRRFDIAAESQFLQSRQGGCNLFFVMVDIDDFKAYNDTYGHVQGDECLRRVAKALERTCKVHGVFTARYGGEEFVCMADRHTEEELRQFAERLVKAVEALNIRHGKSAWERITISVGYASLSEAGARDYQKLLECADAALYQAKTQGKNCARRWRTVPL